MAGDERTRFCRECNKSVYNLSAMTRAQAAALISEKQGKLCARFSLRPDGTLSTLEPAAAPNALRGRASRLAAAVFTAAFSLCASVFAQTATSQPGGSPARTAQGDVKRENRQRTNESRARAARIRGTVYDFQEAVIPQAKLTLISESTQHEQAFETNDEGVFTVDGLEAGLYTLVSEVSGFAPFRKTGIKLRAGHEARLDVTMQLAMMGEIISINEPLVKNPALNFVVETLSLPYRGLKKIVKAVPR